MNVSVPSLGIGTADVGTSSGKEAATDIQLKGGRLLLLQSHVPVRTVVYIQAAGQLSSGVCATVELESARIQCVVTEGKINLSEIKLLFSN
jgi:hypothetical protein